MSELVSLIQKVEQLIQHPGARLSTAIETGYDEALLVGTKDAYLRLVKEVLQFLVDAENRPLGLLRVEGMELPMSSEIDSLFNSCEVELHTTLLTSSEQETQNVANYFLRISPP